MATTPKTKSRDKKAPAAFTITIQMGDWTLQGTGETAEEALKSIPRPAKISTKAVVTVTHGDLAKRDMPFTIARTKRLFYTAGTAIQAKMLFSGLK